tara:strand:- start:1672 stop:3408 length:1737 start_codon:yes stop_codon:yes gene_type:complete
MESLPLNLSDPNMLAEFVPQSLLKTFFEKRFASPEDLGAILFRDGAVIDAYTGTQFTIGGLWENMKGVIGGSHHYAIMLADLKPFDAVVPVRGISHDNVEVVGEATMRLQLNPEKITNILGLMRGVSRAERDADSKKGDEGALGRKALMVSDVIAMLEPHLRERVFGEVIRRHRAEELRGSYGMQDLVQADAMKEVERLLNDVGVLIHATTVNFAMNEAERQAFEKAKIERDEKMKDFALKILKDQIAREADSTTFTIQSNVDLAKVERAASDELRTMVLDSEVAFVDAREMHQRRQEFEALDHEAKLLFAEHEAKTELTLKELEDAVTKSLAEHELVKVGQQRRSWDMQFDREQTSVQAKWQREEEAAQAEFKRKQDAAQREHDRDEGLEDSRHGLSKTKIDTEASGISADEQVRQTREWNKVAIDNLNATNAAEIAKSKGMTEVEVMKMQAESKAEIDKMLAAGSMTAEQLAIYMPGISQSAADVAIAKAKAEGQNAQQMLDMMERMNAQSREHEHRMVETGMKGGTGMAAGLGRRGSVAFDLDGGDDTTVECPKCKRTNPAKAVHCFQCGTQLRN